MKTFLLKTWMILLNSNNIQNVFKKIKNYNPGRKWHVLIVFDDMIADIISNKELNKVVTEMFSNCLFSRTKRFRLDCTHFLWTFLSNKSFNKLQLFIHQILPTETCTAKPYLFSGTVTTLASDNRLRFRKNLLEKI